MLLWGALSTLSFASLCLRQRLGQRQRQKQKKHGGVHHALLDNNCAELRYRLSLRGQFR